MAEPRKFGDIAATVLSLQDTTTKLLTLAYLEQSSSPAAAALCLLLAAKAICSPANDPEAMWADCMNVVDSMTNHATTAPKAEA